MKRVIVIVMDGCGVGALPDAAAYGAADPSSATLPHVGSVVGGLRLPTLEALGLGHVAPIAGLSDSNTPRAAFGKMAERSAGKDSVTGHWEMMGIVTDKAFPTYPNGFPPEVIEPFEENIGTAVLGNLAASGTEIISRLGSEHVITAKPIVYTSADSVFQIAAHEDVIPLDRLYAMCEVARRLLTAPNNVQRVIARPFAGDATGGFRRTANRRDYPLRPAEPNLLTVLRDGGKKSQAIGVIADLFPAEYFARSERTQSNAQHLRAIAEAVVGSDCDFIFANCEDFDMLYGHRNDAAGFAEALVEFDSSLGEVIPLLRDGDLLIVTADHGNDPTTASTDHSREYVPVLATSPTLLGSRELGNRTTLCDIAATIASHIEIDWSGPGDAML